MNGKRTREKGIDLAFSNDDTILKPKLVTLGCKLKWEELPDSQICEFQGFL